MYYFSNLNSYIEIGLILFYIGLAGVLLNKSNLLISILSIELMFYGINYYTLLNSLALQNMEGFTVAIFILTVAAAESALALGILMVYFKMFRNILL
jgi:NADH-quinone oxidoreductase subunit K